MEDPLVEPEHQDEAESSDVPTNEKQEDVEPERCSGGEAHTDGDESGLGEEEEESSECEEEEEEEVEPEQDDETKIQSRPCILEGGDAEAQHVRKYIRQEVRSC